VASTLEFVRLTIDIAEVNNDGVYNEVQDHACAQRSSVRHRNDYGCHLNLVIKV
jgi:hypothetical protein